MITLKRENQLNLYVVGDSLILDDNNKKVDITNGVMFDERHYGFTLVTSDGKRLDFETQCSIIGVDVDFEIIRIYEEGKYICWKIDKNTGEVREHAKFLNISRMDIKYLREHFGLTEEYIDRVNSYFEEEQIRKIK